MHRLTYSAQPVGAPGRLSEPASKGQRVFMQMKLNVMLNVPSDDGAGGPAPAVCGPFQRQRAVGAGEQDGRYPAGGRRDLTAFAHSGPEVKYALTDRGPTGLTIPHRSISDS